MSRLASSLRATLIATTLTFASVIAHAATVNFQADLKASSEVPPNATSGHGMLKATLDTDTMTLDYSVTYQDLSGPAVAAHFHGPAEEGKNAGVQVPVTTKPLSSPIEGKATLTAAQVQQLTDGKWYFNVHTAKNPGGEIRGQVTKQ